MIQQKQLQFINYFIIAINTSTPKFSTKIGTIKKVLKQTGVMYENKTTKTITVHNVSYAKEIH